MIKFFAIILGIYLLVITILSLARRRMTEQFCLLWGFLSVVSIIFGATVNPSELYRYISKEGLLIVMLGILLIVCAAWFLSIQVSVLIRKNQELAMQISLLNQENEQILKTLRDMREQTRNDS